MIEKNKAALLSKPAQEIPLVHHTKIDRILAALKVPHGLNRFEAERLGDHCLNSTVAQLREDGFNIHDEWETVPTRYNPKGVRVKRYRCVGLARV